MSDAVGLWRLSGWYGSGRVCRVASRVCRERSSIHSRSQGHSHGTAQVLHRSQEQKIGDGRLGNEHNGRPRMRPESASYPAA